MFKRGRRELAMAPVVALPTGNVEVRVGPVLADVPVQQGATDQDQEQLDGWTIRTAAGVVLRGGLTDRATASRMLGVLATHGAPLPLILYRPDGQPAGERLG